MLELTCSLNNYKMICSFLDLSLIDESSGVMVYAVDPIIDCLSLVTSQVRVSLTSTVVSMYESNRCYLFMEKTIWKLKNLHILSTPIF